MDLVTLLIVQAIAFLILLVWLKRRVDRELSADRALEQVRKEVGDLITELNATTERNITLIEDRVQRLNRILETTDRKIGVLKKEAEKHEFGSAMYTDLLNQRRRQVRESGDAVPVERNVPPFVGSSRSSEKRVNTYSGDSVSAAGSEDDSEVLRGAGQSEGSSEERTGSGDARRDSHRQPPVSRGEGLRNQVRDLHRAGLDAVAIARRLGSTLGEVELIIGLEAGSEVGNNEDSPD